ncbi:hypothetical protein Tco_0957390 [Tanacetum coccineum]
MLYLRAGQPIMVAVAMADVTSLYFTSPVNQKLFHYTRFRRFHRLSKPYMVVALGSVVPIVRLISSISGATYYGRSDGRRVLFNMFTSPRSKAISLDAVDFFVVAVHGGWRWWSVGAAISPMVITRDSLAHVRIAYIVCFFLSYVLISVSREGVKHRKREGGYVFVVGFMTTVWWIVLCVDGSCRANGSEVDINMCCISSTPVSWLGSQNERVIAAMGAFDKQNVSNRTTVVGWKGALSVEADLSGWDLRDTTNGIMEVTSNPFVLPGNNNGYYTELSKVKTA